MSLLFIMMFVGSLISGLTNVWLTDRLGFGLVRSSPWPFSDSR